MPTRPLLLLLTLIFISCQKEKFQLQEGDLLFQKWEESDFAQAINAVTQGYDGHDFAHVGLVVKDNDSLKVFEATMSNGVGLTPLDSFLQASLTAHQQPNVAVGRLKPAFDTVIADINHWVLQQLNKPYDTLFIYGNEKYYCSELIHDAFNTHSEIPIFSLEPMTFKDPHTGDYFPVWIDYFQAFQAPIPEGELGINPGLMSRSPHIDIVHEFF